MSHTEVFFFRERDGSIPLLKWLQEIDKKVQLKCLVRLERLEEMGHELRRPEADYLRDGIYELRIRHQRVNYRMLYFFHGKGLVVVSHGLTKEREVPSGEIDRAIERASKVKENFEKYTFQPPEG